MPRKLFNWKTLLFLLLALLAASEIFITSLLSSSIANGMLKLSGSESASATVENKPAILMLGGKFKEVKLQTTNTKVDKVIFHEMQAVLKDVEVDMGALINRELVLKSVGDVDLVATLNEDELAHVINTTVKGAAHAKVKVTEEGVKLSSDLTIGQLASVKVSIEGKIVAEGQTIKLVTQKFSINNMLVGNIGGSMFTQIPIVDVKRLPFGVSLRTIVMDEGKVMIYADNRNTN